MVNWSKCVLLSKVIATVDLPAVTITTSSPTSTSSTYVSTASTYAIAPVDEIQRFLAEYPTLGEKDLWALSIALEPRENKS